MQSIKIRVRIVLIRINFLTYFFVAEFVNFCVSTVLHTIIQEVLSTNLALDEFQKSFVCQGFSKLNIRCLWTALSYKKLKYILFDILNADIFVIVSFIKIIK